MREFSQLDSRTWDMSGAPGGTKTVFPLSLPLAAQTLLFPGPANSLVRCGHGRGNISPLESARSHCSCDKLHCHSSSPAMNTHNRILLPVSPASQTVPSSFGSYSGSSLSDPWLRIASAASRSNYESVILNGFPLYGKFSSESYPALDYALLANARRKNATRETTSTLKSWLNEHRKNPYPTKGEKIMLAILTKMTLTQVSTWFANARRRLKKENKMTWSPRKKTGDRKVSPGGGKNDNLSDCDSDGDDDDGEDMDIHIEVEVDSELSMPKLLPAGLDGGYGLSGDIRQSASASASASRHGGSEPVVMPRASVIRAMDSPTFDEIKSRFKENSSPVNNLQRWVNGCFVTAVGCDYPRQLTPPTTPVDDRVSPSASDKAFDSFGVKCDYPATDCTGEGSAGVVVDVRGQPPPPLISVMTPQPSPRASDKTGLTTVGDGNQVGRTRHVQIISPDPVQNEVRTQGLTTSREFEAVLALTALSKT